MKTKQIKIIFLSITGAFFLVSCASASLKNVAFNADRINLNGDISKLNGSYANKSENSNCCGYPLDHCLDFEYNHCDSVTIKAIDSSHVKIMLMRHDTIIKSREMHVKLYDNCIYLHNNKAMPMLIINIFRNQLTRISILNNGDINVDSADETMVFLAILPITGGRNSEYDLRFKKISACKP